MLKCMQKILMNERMTGNIRYSLMIVLTLLHKYSRLEAFLRMLVIMKIIDDGIKLLMELGGEKIINIQYLSLELVLLLNIWELNIQPIITMTSLATFRREIL